MAGHRRGANSRAFVLAGDSLLVPADNSAALHRVLTSHWWVFVLRGALAVLFGAAMLAWPEVSPGVLAWFVCVWFVGDGAMALLLAFDHGRKALRISEAAVAIATGLIALFESSMEGVALLVLIVISAFVRGILKILLAVELGSANRGAWVFGALGAVAIAFAAVLLWEAANGALAALPLIAGFALLLGVAYVAVGFWIERADVVAMPTEFRPGRSPKA